MAVLDTDILSEIQRAVIEPADGGVSWPSGLWTAAEVLGYLNQRQNRFLKETYLLGSFALIPAAASTLRYNLPDDWIATITAWWITSDWVASPLAKSDAWEADHGIPDWPTVPGTKPLIYMDAETSTLLCQVAPMASADGTIEIIYVGLPAVLTGTGELITLPDEFVPYLKWGVLADMLGKAGRGQDIKRAAYAESRYQEGITVARSLLAGWN